MNLIHLLQNGYTPLHKTVEWDAIAVAELLIRHGADVNSKNKVFTPIPISVINIYIVTIHVFSALFLLLFEIN